MARTSKKTLQEAEKLQNAKEFAENKTWNVGIYARLSVDSHNEKNESIDIQIQIAKDYIKHFPNMKLIDCYTDLGKTGTHFNREGFAHLMTDVRKSRINCIIVKDFSRLGRNYIETGNYIEKVFPYMNVRFVAVTDHYDSELDTAGNDPITVNLKNIVNELYARDIAERVKSSKKIKQEMGSYTGGASPYGYCIQSEAPKRVLIPDSRTSEIITKIFDLFINGSTYREIIKELYEQRVNPPKVYFNTKQVKQDEKQPVKQWNISTLKGILSNPVYIGTLLQGRTCGRYYQAHKLHNVAMDDISVVEHAHEPLISDEVFFKAIQRFDYQSKYSNKDGFSKAIPMQENVFKGIVHCGECGGCMRRNPNVKRLSSGDLVRHYYFLCPGRQLMGYRTCKCQGISERTLIEIIRTVMEKEFKLSEMKEKDYCQINSRVFEQKKGSVRKEKKRCVKRLDELSLKNSQWYLQYRSGTITKESFITMKGKAEQEKESLQKKASAYEKQLCLLEKEEKKINCFIRGLIKFRKNPTLDKELVQILIQRINIYSEHRIEIIFNYRKKEVL